MSYFSFEEAYGDLQKHNPESPIVETEQIDRLVLYMYYDLNYETVCKIYRIKNKYFIIYDVFVGSPYLMFNIKEIR